MTLLSDILLFAFALCCLVSLCFALLWSAFALLGLALVRFGLLCQHFGLCQWLFTLIRQTAGLPGFYEARL